MGQTVTNHIESLKDDVVKEAHSLKEIMDITHEEFTDKVGDLNRMCSQAVESDNRRLSFSIREGSDDAFFWKQTVRIICMRVLENSEDLEIYKVLTLRQFLVAYKMMSYHFSCMQRTDENPSGDNSDYMKDLSTSTILDSVTNHKISEIEECIICMERKPEVTLPCAHAYCLFCIEQWNVSNKTCPVCRSTLENTDDSWITPDIPESSEINAEVKKALTALTEQLPEEDED